MTTFSHNNAGRRIRTGKGLQMHTCSRETWTTCVCSVTFHDSLALELRTSPVPLHHSLSERHKTCRSMQNT